MSGYFDYQEYEDDTRDRLREWFFEDMEAAAYASGHGGYTGTIAEKRFYPLEFHDRLFPSREEAEEYLLKKNDKWGPAFAVSFLEGGKKRWMIGGWCSS